MLRTLLRASASHLVALLVASTLVVSTSSAALAQQMRLLRDAEIENTIRTFVTPVLQAAGLNPNTVTIYLVEDPRLNAFATTNQRMFLNSGFLTATDGPGEVIGVLAHEAGHIAGGHLSRMRDEVAGAQMTSLAAALLGIGAALLTGDPRAASAGSVIGGDIALKNFLQYSQSQEQAADQAAITYLRGAHYNPEGLVEFMRKLDGQRVLNAIRQDPYLSTHPMTDSRIRFLEREVAQSPYKDKPWPPEWLEMFERMKAKLIGYLEAPAAVARAYPASDDSLPARYARAISTYRNSSFADALVQVEALIAERPQDPFFQELKGQILLESGKVAEAEGAYGKAVELLPGEPQLRLQLALVQIQTNSPATDQAALENLTKVLAREPGDASAWRLSAIANGRLGNEGMAAMSLAEYNFARGEWRDARGQAEKAMTLLTEHSTGWLRAADIAAVAERNQDRADKR
ncbi:MAG: M48 family metalloprotease [Tistlia sp.]|uniref:M48 family metalloprotease n=1 Tax=Tistlia sp. TaxID=3057121 RepID=UPI0034A17C91